MSRDRGPRRLRRLDRRLLIAATVTALSLTASGCVVVHGEREVLPSSTRAEAAKALTQFTAAYNKGGSLHWLLLFTRGSLAEPFQVAYLTLITPGSLPRIRTDKDGWAQAV